MFKVFGLANKQRNTNEHNAVSLFKDEQRLYSCSQDKSVGWDRVVWWKGLRLLESSHTLEQYFYHHQESETQQTQVQDSGTMLNRSIIYNSINYPKFQKMEMICINYDSSRWQTTTRPLNIIPHASYWHDKMWITHY